MTGATMVGASAWNALNIGSTLRGTERWCVVACRVGLVCKAVRKRGALADAVRRRVRRNNDMCAGAGNRWAC